MAKGVYRTSFMTRWLIFAGIAFAIALETAVPAQTAGPLVLTATFSDGRVLSYPLRPTAGNAWTPMFPRVTGWQPAAGGEIVRAVQFTYALDGQNARVTVSVMFDTAHLHETVVKTYALSQGTIVTVDPLADFGVAPMKLAVVAMGPVAANQPSVANDTLSLEIAKIETDAASGLRYHITVHNRTTQAVRTFTFAAFVGSSQAPRLNPRLAGHDGAPIVEAGGVFTFDVAAPMGGRGSSATTPSPVSHIEIRSALLADGSLDGRPGEAAVQRILDNADRVQLQRIVTAFASVLNNAAALPTAGDLTAATKAALEALDIAPTAAGAAAEAARLPAGTITLDRILADQRSSLSLRKSDALKDVAAVEAWRTSQPAPPSLAAVHERLSTVRARFAAWLGRLPER
jgi:hypothetical protein